MPKAILVTGFEPFGDQKVNASWEVAWRLPREINGARIFVRQLPVVYYKSIDKVLTILEQHEEITDVIMLGEAGGRSQISVEMIGVNCDDASIPDNEGTLRNDTPIYEEGPDGLFATIPAKNMVKHLNEDCCFPAYASWSAGQFVCNHTLYGVVYNTRGTNRRAGFVHLPYTTEQAEESDLPGMPVEEMARGVVSMIRYLIST